MTQSIGIHLGERSFHLVALDGSLKKHKVVCRVTGEIPSGDEAATEVVDRIKAVIKEHKLDVESAYLAIDSGAAAFRGLTLPFDDRAKIEEVIKFEIEGNLPQYDIDQVVVDFLVLSSKPGVESNLLVTAVPKERLASALRICERAGVEPLEAELEGTALFDAAFESGVLAEDVGTVLIHVGDTSTTVVVADGRRLASMRAIRVGAYPSRGPDAAEEEGEAAEAPADDAERVRGSIQRIHRELVRTLSGARSASEVRRVYVCGHALPGLEGESLSEIPIETLPLTLADEPAGQHVVAFGCALRGLEGGTLRPSLRREELRFSGRFERLELPLAVFSLLVFTLLFVQYIVIDKRLEWRDEGDLSRDPKLRGDMQIWLEASNQRIFPDPTNARPVRLTDPPEDVKNYAAVAEAGGDQDRSKYQEMAWIKALLERHISEMSKELGQSSDIKQPQSALTASTLVMKQIAELGEAGRVGIRRFEASYQQRAGSKDDFVAVVIDADFFGADSLEATRSYNQLESLFKNQPWCLQFEGKSTKSLDGDKGIQVDGLTIQVDVDRALQGGRP